MKESLKKVTKYFSKILFVALVAPIILMKLIMDPVFQILIALIHALLNDAEACDNSLKSAMKNID